MQDSYNLVPLLLLFLSGCASNIPLEIRQDITDEYIPVKAASANPEQNEGKAVRWGGKIAGVENNANDTWIEIVGKDLNSWGQPLESDSTQGRFIVRIDGFLDPSVYKVDREITVYGRIESSVVRQIDEHPYTYPLIKAQSYYLWSDYQSRHYYYYPYYYHYPFYPYYYGPYYYHHFGYYSRFHFGHHHHW